MTPSARLSAVVELLDTIFGTTGRAEQVVGGYFRTRRYAGSKDRRWVSEFLYSVLRRMGEIDWTLEKLGLEQTNRMRAIVATVVLDQQDIESVIETNFVGTHALDVPTEEEATALRTLTDIDAAEMPNHVKGNFPSWIVDKLQTQYGDRSLDIMAAYTDRAPVTFRVNSLKATRDDVLKQMTDEGIEVRKTELSPIGIIIENRQNLAAHSLLKDGILEIQDEAAQVSALLAEAGPGLQVVDYCAGGGGKTLAMGANMANEGQIYALDIEARRMRDVASRCKRANLHIVQSHVLVDELPEESVLHRLPGKMDIVFVDAPCSGSGSWRRQPEQRWHLTEERLVELQDMQIDILNKASDLVAPGGKLVYATCSILSDENGEQIKRFLADHPEFKVHNASQAWSDAEIGGEMSGEFMELTPETQGTDGFFTAILLRNA